MKWIHFIYSILFLFLGKAIQAQETFPRNDVKDKRIEAYAFINANIIVDHQETLNSAILLIKNGVIESVGKGISIPKGYQVVDAKGKYIYASWIDLHTNYGLPVPERSRGGSFSAAEQIQSKTKGAYNSNEAIKASYKASDEFSINSKTASDFRKGGFGTVLSFRRDGLARGSSVLVTLGEESDNKVVLKNEGAAHYSFNRGTSRQNYPRSMMGYISLLRQTYLDSEWFAAQIPRPFADKDLEAWINLQKKPQFFDAGSWLNVLRADKVGDEFGIQYIIKSNGDSYKRIKQIKNSSASLIVPLNFPKAYDVEDPFEAEKISLADMLHWELAPTNAGVLEQSDITFALTSDGIKDKKSFRTNIIKAIKHGLSEQMAIRALTTIPAQLMGVSDQIGSIKKGMLANFLITNGPIFDEKTVIYENWIQGKPFRYKPLEESDLAGEYLLSIQDKKYNLIASGKPGQLKLIIKENDSTSIDIKSKFTKGLVSFSFSPSKKDPVKIRLSGWSNEKGWNGRGQLGDGTWIDWEATKTGKAEVKNQKKKTTANDSVENLGQVIYPFMAFGTSELPISETILIKNSTVWTNEKEGIINTDVLLQNGKIAKIGRNLPERNTKVIDGSGKHLTVGIIDEHTHIAGGGNDGATNSSMVRIGDQVNSEDINLYRTLAGGVTTAQVLHGSANPIGGQSALIKLRWGSSPEDLIIDNADEFIKFALGENVKRSRSQNSIRYPQTRMGVEQVYVDAFTNALEYDKKWKFYNALSNDQKANEVKPRRDLVNEAMLEIINQKRFITCHSYVQSEINMLIKVADRFGFNVNTFTHILEGYKVADKMKAHGAGASTFSDWWNYKWEVRYAIPYNATIMHNEGVVTAINSDDANSGRRLNQEAAKSVKYGNMSEEDAWKMVTLNPAKLLHLDDRIGSIKVGKDADVVLWTDHPLSVYARAEKTIIDGKIYFDINEDQIRRKNLVKERTRLIQKMLKEKKAGRPTQMGPSRINLEMHCDDMLGEDLSDHNH